MSAEEEAISLSEEAESEGEGPQIRPPQANVAASLLAGKSSKHKHKSNKKDRDYSRRNRDLDRRERKKSGGDRGSRRERTKERRRERELERRHRSGDDLRNKLSRDKVYDRQLAAAERGHHRGGALALSSSAELRHKYDREMSLLTAEEREKRHEQEKRKQYMLAANRDMETRRREAEDRRKEAEARKKTKEIEREMYRLEEALKRKAAEGRSRSGSRDTRKKKKKRRKKSETPEEEDAETGDESADGKEDGEEEKVVAQKSSEEEGSEEEEEEEEAGSGEEEDSSSEEEDSDEEAGSDATTGSQKSEETPDRDEESSEEGELEEEKEKEEAQKTEEEERRRKKKRRSHSPIEGKWADRSPSRSSDDDRSLSRSPTPLRGGGAAHSGNDSDRTPRSKQRRGDDSPLSRPASPHRRGGGHQLDSPPVSPVPLKDELPPYLPSVHGCRSVAEFKCLNRIEEGTYGVVYRARDKRTQEIVALKRLKMEREKEGFPITSLREINTLLISQHPNVVTVREIVVGSNMDQIYIVMDFVHHDLKSLMETMRKKNQVFLVGEIKCLMVQLLRAIHHLHDNWILHRDLKASNLLLSHNGILKVGDFGLAREYGSPLKHYTSVVVTLWYRAPELLLGIKEYSTHIDVWSIGCIFGELLLMEPLFPGKSEVDELNRIFKLLGTPSEKIWSGYKDLPGVQKMKFVDYPISHLRDRFPDKMLSEQGLSLLKGLLTYDPKKRLSCETALHNDYFREAPLPIDPSMFPTWPAKSEQEPGDKVKKISSPKPPSGGGAFKNMGGDADEDEERARRGFSLIDAVKKQQAPPAAGWNLKF